jgi:3-hydroxyisobutyrate dehydrogenase
MAGTNAAGSKVAFIGLGAMGRPMAATLLRAGHQVAVVPHRDPTAAQWLAKRGAEIADAPAVAAQGASFVVTSLPGPIEVDEVLFGPDGVVRGADADPLVLDTSTVAPAFARSVAAHLAEHGMSYVDAPVSGGPARAADGTLTIIVGGSDRDIGRARPILVSLGRTIFHAGAVGTGQVAKACNNLLVAANMLANAEALALGVSAGLSQAALHEILLACTGANWQLEHIVPRTILRHDYSPIFAIDLLRKDLEIAAEMAAEGGVPAAVGDLAREMYRRAAAVGGGGMDFSSVANLYRPAEHPPPADGADHEDLPA